MINSKSINTKKSKYLGTKNFEGTENIAHYTNNDTFNAEQPKNNDDGNNYQRNTKGCLGVPALLA